MLAKFGEVKPGATFAHNRRFYVKINDRNMSAVARLDGNIRYFRQEDEVSLLNPEPGFVVSIPRQSQTRSGYDDLCELLDQCYQLSVDPADVEITLAHW